MVLALSLIIPTQPELVAVDIRFLKVFFILCVMSFGCSINNNVPVVSSSDFLSIRDSIRSGGGSYLLLDVREKEEFAFTKIEGSNNIPLGELENRIEDLKAEHINTKIIVICRSGARSAMATEFMLKSGFSNVFNLEGGLLALSKLDQSITPY